MTENDNRKMWQELGIDMEKHDELLSVLPGLFSEVYMKNNPDRPTNMQFWDFVVGDIHGIRIKELVEAKNKGKKVFGTYCLYVPEEIIVGLGGICIGLCGGTSFSNYAVDDILPANLCPLIKSAPGFAFGNICPYYLCTDLLIGETTCDGKKKAWEVLSEKYPVYVMNLPQVKNGSEAKELYKKELMKLMEKISSVTGVKPDAAKLAGAYKKIAAKRKMLSRIYESRKADPVPISGRDALLVSQVAFYDDPDRQVEMLGKLAAKLEERVNKGKGVFPKGTKRILISGTPMAIPNWKLHDIIEKSGAVVVYEETCTGYRYFADNTAYMPTEESPIEEIVDKIAERYINISCACFTPNDKRLEDIIRLAEEYSVDGIILYTLSFCQIYEMEAVKFAEVLKKKGFKVLNITTDYSDEDTAMLKNRIEAFIEIL